MLGIEDPEEMMRRHDESWLRKWEAYASIEPFGPQQNSMLIGVLASVIANSSGKEYKDIMEPSDFVPYLIEPADIPDVPVSSADDVVDFFKQFKSVDFRK